MDRLADSPDFLMQAEIVKNLPRVVATLADGAQESKNLVRSVFTSIVQTPSQTFGTVTSNLPRVRQSELLTPAELMVLLHESEKEVGLKPTIDGQLCHDATETSETLLICFFALKLSRSASL
jgi:symplekin